MRKFDLSIEVNASKEEVWKLLFDQFGSVSNFNPLIADSFDYNDKAGEVGSERQCNFDPEGKKFVRERITDKWENGFNIDIYYGGLPMIKKVFADVYIDPITEDRTKVKFVMHYQSKPAFMGGIMKGMLKKQFFQVLIGMKYHIETGGLVTDKNIKEIKRRYNQGSNEKNFAFQPNVQLA